MPGKGCCNCIKRVNEKESAKNIATHNNRHLLSSNVSLLNIDGIEPDSDSIYGSDHHLLSRTPPLPVPATASGVNTDVQHGVDYPGPSAELTKEIKAIFRLSGLNLPPTKYSAVRALLFTLAAILGESPEYFSLKMDKSFFEIGGTAENTLVAVACLHHYKFKIDVLDFLRAKTLREIVMNISRVDEAIESKLNFNDLSRRYKASTMKPKDTDFLFGCFKYANIKVPESYPYDWAETWKSVLRKGTHVKFSRKPQQSPVGLVLNFDLNDDVHNKLVPIVCGKPLRNVDIQKHSFEMSSKSLLIELLQYMADHNQKKGKLVHPVFLITDGLSEPEKVALIIFMEVFNLRHVKNKKFRWVVTNLRSVWPLQSQIEKQILGFEVLESKKSVTEGDHDHYVIATTKL